MRIRLSALAALLAALLSPAVLPADDSNFDLAGPGLKARVTRGAQTLDLAAVPNLKSGDKLWIQPDFPASEAAHYLVIVIFLRGATNPPPEDWFHKAEAWDKKVRTEGFTLTVPPGAEQAMLMLAPETGGDFSTLRGTVRARPGAFVRAVQDLDQADLQRTRLDAYLATVKQIATANPAELSQKAPMVAQSLKIKLDKDCFARPLDQQEICLTQNSGSLVLDDANTQSMVAQLTSGNNADLIGQLSATRQAGGGMYSPYVGAVVDVVRIFGSMYSAKYQYIPALTTLDGEKISLRLNNPPSFRNPKSVIVCGLPPIGPEQAPMLFVDKPENVYCLQSSSFVLPVEGAPLFFSTGYGRDWRLEMNDAAGKQVSLAVKGDAIHGGLVLANPGGIPAGLEGSARLKGYWGFGEFAGPSFHLVGARVPGMWQLKPDESTKVYAGQADTVHLLSPEAGCVEKIVLASDPATPLKWKLEEAGVGSASKTETPKPAMTLAKPVDAAQPESVQAASAGHGPVGVVEVELPLEKVKPGELALQIKQFSIGEPETLKLHAYTNEVKLVGYQYYEGDRSISLKGQHLEQVASLDLSGVHFTAGSAAPTGGELILTEAQSAAPPKPTNEEPAKVELHDGRTLEVKGASAGPRPQLTLLGKQVTQAPSEGVYLRLGDAADLPVTGTLTFFLKSPVKFDRAMKLEVANEDESVQTELSFADGTLILQDATTARAELNPSKSIGQSVYGPLRFRAVDARGAKSDWQPLARLVRLPKLTRVLCPEDTAQACQLEGGDLFLISAVAADEKFTAPASVPEGFTGRQIAVPRPNGTLLYLKLRDDPDAVNRLLAPVYPQE